MSEQSSKVRVPIQLPTRQQQVLRLLADGNTTHEIASELGISPKTVEFHRMKLMVNTGLNSYQELTKLAIRLGMTTINV